MPADTARLHLLSVGHCVAPEALTARGAAWRIARFPAGIALLRHPRHGHILFDTGYGAAFWQATAPFPERIYRWLTPVSLPTTESLPAQLARLEVPKVDLVVLSHLHADHVAGLFDLYPMPPVLAPAAAIGDLSKGRIASLRAGVPRMLQQRLIQTAPARIEDRPEIALNRWSLQDFGTGHDLFGDQSVIAVPLPGHGAGQTGFWLPDLPEGPTFLIADAAWSISALRDNRPPPDSTLRRLGQREAYLQTFARLRLFQLRNPRVRLIASHCPESYPPVPPSKVTP